MSEIEKNIRKTVLEIDLPEWHLKYLEYRDRAIAEGEDSFISLDEFEADLRSRTKRTLG